MAKKFAKDSKQTWSVIREILGTKTDKNQIPTFFQNNSQVISDYLEIANGFNTFVAGIGPKLADEVGPTDVSYDKLSKEIAPIIITPLHYLINLSLETGFVPPELKLAKIVPIFKDGNSHEFTNYRPISLLSSFSKLFEKIVTRQLIRFLNVNEILYQHQYGF